MTEQLYLNDSYSMEFDAVVTKVDGKYVVLDRTLFYAEGGGQPADSGKIVAGGVEYNIVYVKKMGADISIEVDKEGLKVGDKIHGIVDWERRYKLMRYHTAAHLLSAVIFKETGALISGNQLGIDKSRIDFSLEDYDKDKIKEYERISNELINKKLPVHIKWITRKEAEANTELVKLMKGLPAGIDKIRIIDIETYDASPCGGTHLKNLSEIGQIEITGTENKGKNNRRIYFIIKP